MKSKDSRIATSTTTRKASILTRATKSLLINPDDLAEPLVTIPPDGGWGWVIVAASFLVMFCVDGVGYCFAIFFEDISKDLECKVTDVAIASSMLGGFYYLAGPLTCSAINRFGFQIIAVLGGVVAIFAFMTASMVNSIAPFTIVIGFFGGMAFNLIYTPSVIAIGFYFERWRALAMAINCCGSSLGVMCVPLIVSAFFEKYTWRTKFKILAGMFGICGFMGFTYKPIKTAKVIERTVQFGEVSTAPSTVTGGDVGGTEEKELNTGITSIFQRFRNALFPTISEVSVGSHTPSRFSSRTSGVGYGYILHRRGTTETEAISTLMKEEFSDEVLSGMYPVDEKNSNDIENGSCKKCCRKCFSCCPRIRNCFKQNTQFTSVSHVNRPMYRDDIFYTGSINLLSEYSRTGESRISRPASLMQKPSLAYTMSVSRAATQRDIQQQNECVICPEAVVRVLATMLHFQMLKSPTFILLLISGYLTLMGTYICYTYVVARAMEMGIEDKSATLLISILGISNTLGRAMCGVVSCFSTDINIISWVTLGICGGITIVSVFLSTFLGQIVFCCIFGFTIATFAVLRTIMFVELFGIENLTNCFGLNMIFQSAAAFSGVPVANLLYKSTNSFSVPFIFTGVIVLLSAVLLIPIRWILKWEQRTMKK